MNIRKYLLEEIQNNLTPDEQSEKLRIANEIGCFVAPWNVSKTAEPVEEAGSQPYLEGKLNNDDVRITVQPNAARIVTNGKLGNTRGWRCQNLDELYQYLSKIKDIGWTTNRPTQMEIEEGNVLTFNLKNGTTWDTKLNKYVKPSDSDTRFDQLQTFFKYTSPILANSTQGINVYKIEPKKSDITNIRYDDRQCEDSLTKLWNYFKRDEPADEARIKVVKDVVQACVYQGRLRSGNVRVGPPNILNKQKQEKISTLVDKLYQMQPYDTWQKNFQIRRPVSESKLSSKVKKTLIETYNNKKNRVIEANIVKTRLDLIIDNFDSFTRLNKNKKIGKGFRYLREASELKKLGFLNEELGNLFQQIFGKSLDSILTNVSEPLLTSIFDKLDLPEDIKTDVTERIHAKTTELLASMDNCENLTNFLSSEISDSIADKITATKILGSELVDSSLNELVKGENFKQNLGMKLKDNICGLFEKFSENAKNLVTKLSEV